MNINELSRKILINEKTRNILIKEYAKGNKKINGIKIDDILECVVSWLHENNNDLLLIESYIIFLIKICSPLVNEEKNIIINYGKYLEDNELNNLTKDKKLIIIVGKIYKETLNKIDVLFNINDNTKNSLMMRPRLDFKHKKLSGIIEVSSNVLETKLDDQDHLITLMYMFYHELDHLIRLDYLFKTKIDTNEKLRCVKEFAIAHILGNDELYKFKHDSFHIEIYANRYAYKRTIKVIDELNLNYKKREYELVKDIYIEDTDSIENIADEIDNRYEYIKNYQRRELMELNKFMNIKKI